MSVLLITSILAAIWAVAAAAVYDPSLAVHPFWLEYGFWVILSAGLAVRGAQLAVRWVRQCRRSSGGCLGFGGVQ